MSHFIPAGTGYDNRAFDTKRAKPLRRKCERCTVLLQASQKRYCKPCSMDVADGERARWLKERDAQRKAAKLARASTPEGNRTKAGKTKVAAKDWNCAALAAPEHQDCEWPICGCDPDANKVIAALQECFTFTPAPSRRERLQEPSPTPDAPFLLGEGELPELR